MSQEVNQILLISFIRTRGSQMWLDRRRRDAVPTQTVQIPVALVKVVKEPRELQRSLIDRPHVSADLENVLQIPDGEGAINPSGDKDTAGLSRLQTMTGKLTNPSGLEAAEPGSVLI